MSWGVWGRRILGLFKSISRSSGVDTRAGKKTTGAGDRKTLLVYFFSVVYVEHTKSLVTKYTIFEPNRQRAGPIT
jgi:hypothetical protein